MIERTAGGGCLHESTKPELRCSQATADPLHQPCHSGTRKGGNLHNMKYLAIIALTVAALGLGACKHEESHATTTTTHSTGYSK